MPCLSHVLRRLALAVTGGLVGACAAPLDQAPPEAAAASDAPAILAIFDAADALERDWRKVSVWGEASFELIASEGEIAIGARAEGASAALVRAVEIDPETCPVLTWSWRVDRLPPDADLSSRASEDVAASVIVAFGDPGSFINPEPVPTLRYAWATESNAAGSIIDSPYFPGDLKTIVVRSGPEGAGAWRRERRNLLMDYEAAFGGRPEGPVEVIALFTDGDHGAVPVEAAYRSADAECAEPPEPPSIFGASEGRVAPG